MGTRGAIGFRINGELKVTYNHFDSYPSGLGQEFLEFVQKHCVSENTLQSLKEKVVKVIMVDEDIPPTESQYKDLKNYWDTEVSNGTDWYALLRRAQGISGLDAIAEDKLHFMIDSKGFLRDSLFCEYAYIIDLDKCTANFYKGFNRDESKTEFGLTSGLDSSDGNSIKGYYPVRTVAIIPFNIINEYDDADVIYGYGEEESE